MAAQAHPDDQAARQKGVEESRTRILELEDNVRHLNEALQKQGHVAAEAALEGARSFTEVIKEVMGLDDEDNDRPVAAGQGSGQSEQAAGGSASEASAPEAPSSGASSASSGTGQSPGTVSRAGAGADISGGPVSTSSVRAEKKVSWFQENMLAVIAGGLAFIVLIVTWLLRRASAARRGIFESDSPITDSMVRDKLREIDLDLDSPPADTASRRGS